MTGELSQFLGRQQLAAMGVQGLQQRGSEASGGTETCPGRNVGQGRNLNLRRPQFLQRERLAEDRMPHVLHARNALERRILEVNAWRERSRYRDVDVFIDRSGDQETFIATIVRRQVGASSSKGDP